MIARLLQRAITATFDVFRLVGAADLRQSSKAGQLQQRKRDQQPQKHA